MLHSYHNRIPKSERYTLWQKCENTFNTISSDDDNGQQPLYTNDAHSPYGAYDMSGNVWEWVADWNTTDINTIPSTNPHRPENGTMRVAKGGCYDSLAEGVRVAERRPLAPEYLDVFTGFRIVASP